MKKKKPDREGDWRERERERERERKREGNISRYLHIILGTYNLQLMGFIFLCSRIL
jgi:hypothetical protein